MRSAMKEKKNLGFTLMETILGLLMITVVGTGVLSVVLFGQRTSVSGEDKMMMLMLLERKIIEFKKNPSLISASKTYAQSPQGTCVTADPCPAISTEYPVCPDYANVDNASFPLDKTRCFYYQVEDLPVAVTGLPSGLKKVTGKVYWENANGIKQSTALETVIQTS